MVRFLKPAGSHDGLPSHTLGSSPAHGLADLLLPWHLDRAIGKILLDGCDEGVQVVKDGPEVFIFQVIAVIKGHHVTHDPCKIVLELLIL